MKPLGVVAAGHRETAGVAEAVLRDGGNAFDAVIAAFFTACVAEPVLASPGGGGFLLAHTRSGRDVLYDFFVHTPLHKLPAETIEFHPICADFGTAQQEFHIGAGAIATPGAIRGVFTAYRELGTVPIQHLLEPAVALARHGIRVNAFQAYIFDIIHLIYLVSGESRRIYGSGTDPGRLVREDEILRQPELGDVLEALGREGDRLFYEGDIATRIVAVCKRYGGHLNALDLAGYEVIQRDPLAVDYKGSRILSNPPPASGGILIAFALGLLADADLAVAGFGTAEILDLLAQVMALTGAARLEAWPDDSIHPDAGRLLAPDYLETCRRELQGRARCLRGTTHISVMDAEGNIASLSVSNGEGCGHMIPGTGIMLNNMLGEEDLNTGGFHRWQPGQRMTSMMAPTIIFEPGERTISLGSGGSNRIRTALLQVIVNLIDHGMSLEEAVYSPRIHYEGELLNIEGGFAMSEITRLIRDFSEYKLWEERNLFFGGAHSVMCSSGRFSGVGDPRRGGHALVAG